MSHVCHAHGCRTPVPPRMFACSRHWRALSPPLKAAIWREYRPGQEVRKDPSARYVAVQRLAVGTLAFRPGDEDAARAAAPYLLSAEVWRALAIKNDAGDPLAGLPGAKPEPLTDDEIVAAMQLLGGKP